MGRSSTAREKLIKSSIELITNRSYKSVGVNELCRHAGVKKGSFYHFFSSKQELTIKSLDVIWNEFREKVLLPIKNLDKPMDEKLGILLSKLYNNYSESKDCNGCVVGCPLGNLALEMSTLDESIRTKIGDIFNDWVDLFEQFVQDAVKNKEIPDNVDTRATAKSIVVYIEGLLLMGKTFNNPEIIQNLGCVTKRIIVYKEDVVRAA